MRTGRLFSLSLVVALLALLAGCAGAAGPHAALLPSVASRPGAVRARKTTRLTFHIPKRHHRSGAHYISAATESAALSIAPATGCTHCTPALSRNYDLAATAPECTSSPAETTCTFALVLAPGPYVGSLATYDGWNSGTSVPSGNVLSQNQHFPLTIVAGKVNAPAVTLEGIASRVQLVEVDERLTRLYNVGNDNTVEIPPGATGRVEAIAYDADDEAILGVGAPSFGVSVGGGFTAHVQGSVIALSAPAKPEKGYFPLQVTPSGCSDHVSCGFSGTVAFLHILAVAYGGSTVEVVDTVVGAHLQSNGVASLSGFNDATYVAFDGNANLFVGDRGAGGSHPSAVREYAFPYTGNPIATVTLGPSSPIAISVAPNGTLAVADMTSNEVTVYPVNGTAVSTTPVSTLHLGNIGLTPIGLAFDSSDNLWMSGVGSSSGNVLEATASTNYSGIPEDLTGFNDPVSLALDSGGNLYVADFNANNVYEYDSPSYTPDLTMPMSGANEVIAIHSPYLYPSGGGLVAASGDSTAAVYQEVRATPVALLGPSICMVSDQDGNLYQIFSGSNNFIGLLTADVGYSGGGYSVVIPALAAPVWIGVFPGS